MKFLEHLNNVLFPDHNKITEEVIQHFERNPDELDLIINKEYFNAVYLGVFFLIGIILTVASRVVQYFYGDSLGEFVNTVVLDVLSELGIAIFGGAIVAYLIELMNKKQFQRNIKYRRQLKAILEERKSNKR